MAIKRYNENGFSEYYQVSNFQEIIGHCPSSGPSMDINNGQILAAFTSYNNQNAYTTLSDSDNIDFGSYLTLNPNSSDFQNYPYILLDNNIHAVWVELNNFDVYYGMRNLDSGIMENIQQLNIDDTNSTQKDPIIYKQDENLYSFWSDNRHGYYEIYFSKAHYETINLGDVNQDQVIDILDVVIIVNIILGQHQPDIQETLSSDLNEDGLINIQDIVLIVNMILN